MASLTADFSDSHLLFPDALCPHGDYRSHVRGRPLAGAFPSLRVNTHQMCLSHTLSQGHSSSGQEVGRLCSLYTRAQCLHTAVLEPLWPWAPHGPGTRFNGNSPLRVKLSTNVWYFNNILIVVPMQIKRNYSKQIPEALTFVLVPFLMWVVVSQLPMTTQQTPGTP